MRRRAKGGLESEVLAALWAADRPLTPGEVADALGDELAYNTVQTILIRLHAKGAVAREQRGRAHAYTPVLDNAGLAASRMRAVLDAGDDRAAVLSHFLHGLSAEDESTLLRLLARDNGDASSDGDEAGR
jgi:predicted transcriptional regulator